MTQLPPDIIAAIIGGTFVVMFAVYLAVMIPFCFSLHKLMKHVPKDKESFPIAFIWLGLIPLAGLVFHWMMLPFGIPNGLKKTLPDNQSAIKDANSLKGAGLAFVILQSLGIAAANFSVHLGSPTTQSNIVPLSQDIGFAIQVLLLIPIFVLWIIYWVKAVSFRRKYFSDKS